MIGREVAGEKILADQVLGNDEILQIDVERPGLLGDVEMKRFRSRGRGREGRVHDREAEEE